MGKATKVSGCMGRSLNVSYFGATSFNKATKMVLFDISLFWGDKYDKATKTFWFLFELSLFGSDIIRLGRRECNFLVPMFLIIQGNQDSVGFMNRTYQRGLNFSCFGATSVSKHESLSRSGLELLEYRFGGDRSEEFTGSPRL